MSKKIVMALSGGMDSATLLAEALHRKHEVYCVNFQYGSKHNRLEMMQADRLCDHYHIGFPHRVSVTSAMAGIRSHLMADNPNPIPEGHYEAESMRDTVVPGRNLIFTSLMMGYAWSLKASEVWLGIHAGDHHIYPDCRPSWFEAMKQAVELGSDGQVTLVAKFLNMDKAHILKLGTLLGVPYHKTRTCYTENPIACGRCGSCQERLWAFDQQGIKDPLDYLSRKLYSKAAMDPVGHFQPTPDTNT